MKRKPNIVLINVDQMRADCMGVMGHPVVQTPFLDELAVRGARFTRAYTATPTCIAARAGLMTGLGQDSHGRVGYRDKVTWDYPVTLAGEFTRHGWQTEAIGKMHVWPQRNRLGFEHVVLHDGYIAMSRDRRDDRERHDDYLAWLHDKLGREADYFDHGLDCNGVNARPWDKPEWAHPTTWVATQGIDFLRRRDASKPFFLYLSFVAPHPPYIPPEWAFQRYLSRDLPPAPVGDWEQAFDRYRRIKYPSCPVGPYDAATRREAQAGYYGLITHIDHQFFRFRMALREHGLERDTWFCFVSDHGEMLGDHHFYRKLVPYEGSARVPFILHSPQDAGIRAGIAPDEVVELRDVMPTLLDAAGLPIPPSVEGRSVLPLARGEKPAWRAHLRGEHVCKFFFQRSFHFLVATREKYVWFSDDGGEQLFDLGADPQELHDLAPDPAARPRLEHWRSVLVKELAGREEGFSDGSRLVPGRPIDELRGFLRQRLGVTD